jgi:sec-independent protein translocase protein TatC
LSGQPGRPVSDPVRDPIVEPVPEPVNEPVAKAEGEPQPEHNPIEDSRMTLMSHLIELRNRLLWVVGALIIGTLLSMLFVTPILNFIIAPLSALGAMPTAIGPTDTITVFFKVSFTMGAVFAMPVIIYQIIRFVAPGLYPHEKRNLLLILPGFMALFAIGASFAYFMLLPTAVAFLQSFLGDIIKQEWTIDRYISFVTRIVFWIGVAFEMPLVVAFLARAGIISGPKLLGFWRQAVVIIAVVAAAITPTVDPVNMTLVMAPLIVLYAISVGLAYALYKERAPRDFSQEDFIPAKYKE